MGNKCHKKVIGIICAGIHEEGVQNTVTALVKSIKDKGHKAIVISTFTYYNTAYTAGEVSVFKLINASIYDGFVLMPETIKSLDIWEDILADAKASGKPFVCVDRDVEGCASIVYDYAGAFEKLVRHMVEVHKPKRINFIGGMPDNSFSEERLDVFKKVMAENGREYDPERFGYGMFWEYPTYDVMDDFFSGKNEPPDAIICCNDSEAIAACKYLRDRGIQVPEDIIISGFDGIEQEKYMVPRLTTAACDFEKMCSTAVEQLERALDGLEMERLIKIPYAIRISQSCGCRPLSDSEKTTKLLWLYNQINASAYHEKTMFDYSGHMVDINSYDDLVELMPEYNHDNSWCCINPSFFEDNEPEHNFFGSFDDKMLMFAHVNDGLRERDLTFSTADLLPDLDAAFEESDAIMFVPMGFQGETIGYMAVTLDKHGFNFLYTHRFVNNTNRILEVLKARVRLQTAYAKVADMHMRDPMTGIYNRRGFYMRMADLADKGSTDLMLFSADLDRLKVINDSYGHSAGDTAIIAAAQVISRAAGENAVCARFGGDEFIVVIPSGSGISTFDDYAEKVNEEAEAFNASGRAEFSLGISVGGAKLKMTDRGNIDTAMKTADENMYECKKKHHSIR
ncbi:GGDEF domain-containing protein [Ruminococcus sp.]|uniref:GGDEF domain-containing protein n=1 Tax=Ruminococcus sp. TaxID=41978 RepID=UPI0025EADE02|nr:GGDEF domain-containing protein [Ruminococcus sp.]MBQ8968077.1 GGDEF domain-containing protein [Ruminococcus sp.]